MRTFCRAAPTRFLLSAALTLCFAAHAVQAQTLARKGWAGSGLSSEAWWQSAVFYRIAPENFQDSDGDGLGDLRGIAQRMDYLQALGVDAVVLEAPFAEAGFDDLLDEASRHHIRLLVALPSADGNAALPVARQWLSRGVAGIWLSLGRGEPAEQNAALLHAMRTLTDSFPGQRVLVEDSTADPAASPTAGAQLAARALPAGAVTNGDAVSLRLGLAQSQTVPPGSAPLLLLVGGGARAIDEADPHKVEQEKILAAALLASHGAVALQAGQEIGLAQTATGNMPRRMQWTPSNITTQAKPESAQPASSAKATASAPPPREDVYGAYVPYVPFTVVKPPAAAASKPDLNALSGFTTSKLLSQPHEDAAAVNVAAEDADPNSVLSFYRRLARLHHDNPAVRAGMSYTLDDDADGVLLWILSAPSTARTGSLVVAACNLTGKRVAVPLRADFGRRSLHAGELRPLITSAPSNAQASQSMEAISLAPWSVFVGQLDR